QKAVKYLVSQEDIILKTQASYDLLVKIMNLTKSYPRDYKYSIGEKMQNHMLDLIVDVYKANSSIDKTKNIKSIQEHIQFIGLFLRISMDINIISDLKYSEFVEELYSVDKQASAWLKSLSDNQSCAVSQNVEAVPV
ncbi:MAG: four helix bundle protein, partial [Candidatus Gastranaerophilales bacterium]|nr:four helix bundle protein [Candidatus Gastranaerophilales bacterium]